MCSGIGCIGRGRTASGLDGRFMVNIYCRYHYSYLSSRLLSKNLEIKMYRSIILPVVLYGCGTWSLTLREERWQRVFEKNDEVTGEWRKLHSEELNDLYRSPNIVRVVKSRRMK